MPAIAVVLGACSTTDPSATPRPPRDETSTPSPPSPRSFESARHGYVVEVPPFWDVAEYRGEWTRLRQFQAGAEVAGEDVISSPDGESFLVANSMAIPEGMRAGDWLEAFDALVAAALDPACPGRTRKGIFAGEAATIVEQRCGGSFIVGRSLTHGGRGYYFTTRFDVGDSTAEAAVDDIVASIRFLDG